MLQFFYDLPFVGQNIIQSSLFAFRAEGFMATRIVHILAKLAELTLFSIGLFEGRK